MTENTSLENLKQKALAELSSANTEDALESWRVAYLGKKSDLNIILRGLANLPVEERKAVGADANVVREELETALKAREDAINEESLKVVSGIDISLPGRPWLSGKLHPVTRIVNEITDIFSSLGFSVIEGPEVELDRYNFDALNIPKEHPARDTMQTFWVDEADAQGDRHVLLRTHTSPMQVRFMEKYKEPPIRIVVPGRVFRYEATDASHMPMFHQVEGLMVDRNVSLADLKGTLFEFARRFFGPDRRVRFRCDFFPFVEPGVEMAVECAVCKGAGCRLCGDTGWLEILGAGMVHPKVLEGVGIDPQTYTGFAFGIGVERLPMLRYGIDDIRLFYSNDLRFLRQF
ncbi:phenylalanine--tRNA ligase subunit alpha [Dehalogenimonas etheniformans]|uniref:Phenylalanine--tRNA ligase alpha subunit n=1 Tax=Dehalogenimonas etheniformans TaxID=1536648 RepID=A0A2P5P7T9_9CHLR|nr:phenylalanine--tRNA ligase subunit alpha [Dehalogenimonas etheniformans]PPD58349.1 phenylalanine--tRNA ligase subunit alpha [Dehalogenimonas etheniformans]QNT76921.1 phenylalanine--tRNA ligase subunit alpha [Dehalogenimonas etheniformans]